jgi:hypothetical protein
MTLIIKDTQSNEEQIMEGVTIEQILHAIDRVQKEKARQAEKYQRCVKPKMGTLRISNPASNS